MKKRVLSLLLVLMMVVSLVPMNVFADKIEGDIAYAVTGGNIWFDIYDGGITDCDEKVTEAIIPEEIEGEKVKTIKGYTKFVWNHQTIKNYGAFQNCSELRKVVIPNSVTRIGQYAFSGCTNLSSVVLPKGSYSISDYAFSGCKNWVGTVTLDGVTYLGESAFSGCSSLSKVVIPDGLSLERCLFARCSGLTSVALPKSVYKIDESSFSDCTSLSSVMIPNGVSEIERNAFNNCTALKTVYLPKGLWKIGDDAFKGCDNITDVYYEGTEAEWNKITIRPYNTAIKNATIHYESKYTQHVHSYDKTVTAPTCAASGYTTYTCSCGDTYKDNYIDAIEHEYKNGLCTRCGAKDPSVHTHKYVETVTKPSCTEKGYTTYTCSCGDSYKGNYINALGHSYVNGICTRCSAKNTNYNSAVSFTDVPSTAYYYKPVQWAVENDITAGVGNNKFAPDDTCTRGQVVTFLWRAAGKPTVSTNVGFTDVNPGEYYYEAVRWAVANGITSGVGGNRFAPNDTCTRGQVVTFLHRAAGEPSASAVSSFADVSTDAFYYKAVNWAVANGITSGVGGNRFAPNDSCTRAQVVTFLYREKTGDIGNSTGKDINTIIESVKKSFSARLVVPSVGASDNYYCAMEYTNNTGSNVLFTSLVFANGKGCNSWNYSITLSSGDSKVIKYYRGAKTDKFEEKIKDMYLDNSSTAWTILKINGEQVYIKFGTSGLIAAGASPNSIGVY